MSEYKVFRIPTATGSEQEESLNRFLRGHRVLQVHREFVSAAGESFWAFSIEYLPSTGADGGSAPPRGRVDYREILNSEDFRLFSRLRELRKKLAEQESIPPYTIFTNEQLAEMVRKRVSSAAALQEIGGVGEARARKYGDQFIPITSTFQPSKDAL